MIYNYITSNFDTEKKPEVPVTTLVKKEKTDVPVTTLVKRSQESVSDDRFL